MRAVELFETNDIDAFADALSNELGIVFVAYESGDNIKLQSIIVPKDKRKQGLGTEALERLCQYADDRKKRIILTTGVKSDSHGTTSQSRLTKFYKRFGFVENKGRRKDFSISATMFRDPK